MSCLYFHRPHRDPDDSTESSDSITYWRKLLGRGHTVVVPFGAGTQVFRGGLEVIRCLPPEEGDAEDG